jgi:hypothetical protein
MVMLGTILSSTLIRPGDNSGGESCADVDRNNAQNSVASATVTATYDQDERIQMLAGDISADTSRASLFDAGARAFSLASVFDLGAGLLDNALAVGKRVAVDAVTDSPSAPNINAGKQGKHIPGHNNFIPGRSELTADPNVLVQRAGTGTPVNSVPRGQPGFKERVDFGEIIGNYVDPQSGASFPTTKGIITYANDGVHIIPARP